MSSSPNLRPVNEALREFDQLYSQLHGLITIKVGEIDWVYKCDLVSCSLCDFEPILLTDELAGSTAGGARSRSSSSARRTSPRCRRSRCATLSTASCRRTVRTWASCTLSELQTRRRRRPVLSRSCRICWSRSTLHACRWRRRPGTDQRCHLPSMRDKKVQLHF